jgi:glycerol dehydrogenase-like iron-containing ADH family enzyme
MVIVARVIVASTLNHHFRKSPGVLAHCAITSPFAASSSSRSPTSESAKADAIFFD